MFHNDIDLKDVINPEDWHSIQESLSEALEITLRTISTDGSILAETTRKSRFCSEILPNISDASECSKLFLKNNHSNIKDIEQELSIKCPFGLDVLVVPIRAVGRRIVAYVVVGPVILKGRKSISEYTKDAGQYGIRLEDLMDAMIEINVFSYNKIRAIVRVVESVFSRIAQAGYHKKRLGEIAPQVIEFDPAFSRYYEERILNALLDACTFALDADSGSVMILDKATNMLYIKASSKMDQEVVKRTRVKMGEGIAGIAAASAESIILPKDEKKSSLSGRMTRSNIQSSMIVPFGKGNDPDVYGVLNLNMARKGREFTDRDISLIKELVKMAGIALIPIRQATKV